MNNYFRNFIGCLNCLCDCAENDLQTDFNQNFLDFGIKIDQGRGWETVPK